jgi:alkylation response protein AidB-like acyl-CoA dehydrogenase
MELTLSPEDAAFRDEVRAFIKENYPAEMRVPNPETDLTRERMLFWHRILHKKGWIAPLWPKQYGGPGWSITQRFIFEQETTRAGTPPPLAFSITMVGPVIYTFGNEEQKKRFLPRILSGEDWVVPGLLRAGLGRFRPQHLNLSLSAGEAGVSRLASGAKSKIGYAGKFVADQAVQLHGGMGMTDELNVGHYFKRISSINIQFGDPVYHVLRYAQTEAAA